MNAAVLFTSAVTRGEIYFGRPDLDKKNQFAKLMRRSNVREIDADPRVMGKLLKLSGDVGGYNLKIVHPYPRNAPPAEIVTVRDPLFPPEKTGEVIQ